uniref:Uncharacterized protein n=1 Tax=Rhizophora mucronata TaxID=61149 RepID=A0A2P2QST3_RHIMU
MTLFPNPTVCKSHALGCPLFLHHRIT